MIKEQQVEMIITPTNRVAYSQVLNKQLHNGDRITINVCDLLHNSHALITGICDRCGAEKTMTVKTYNHCVDQTGFYRCHKCHNEALADEFYDKYGVYNPFQLESVQAKSKATNLRNFGHEYPSQRIEQREQMKGENNYFWIDGRNAMSEERNNSQLKSFRRAVFERDHYTCQLCGATQAEDKLNAHHLNSYLDYPDERYDLNNGITLCVQCHKAFHTQYGFGHNHREQFESFRRSNDYPEREYNGR